MKLFLKNSFIFLFSFLIIAALFSIFTQNSSKTEVIGLNNLVSLVNDEQISKIEVVDNNINLTLNSGEKKIIKKEANESFSTLVKNLEIDQEKISKIDLTVKEDSSFKAMLLSLLPILIPVILIAAFLIFMLKGVNGANSKAMMFGQSQAREFDNKQKNKTTFKDVAGAKEAKQELSEIVDFLKFPKKFYDLGAKIPKGVLLLGGPGIGKTLMAKAVAGEANVPFLSISGSEFVEMFVGVGASRVRSLFQKAKKNSPCIIFIDEIDAVGRKRGSGLGGSHDEREQTLNQILVEMDGFEPNVSVIVIAATNRPDVLDPALLRPGRFDRQVMIDMPDIADREAILKIHAKEKPLEDDVDLRRIAERTPGFSGADLANVLNEGAILAARENKKTISSQELFSAIEKVILGPEKKSRIITDKEKQITAYHEAGHAVISHYLNTTGQTHKVSIIGRGQAGGYTLRVPNEDRHLHSKSEYLDEIAVMLGGYLIEIAVFGEMTTGASSDLSRATALARNMVTSYGMSDELGPRTFGKRDEMIFLGKEIHEERDYSEKLAEKIDMEINETLNQARAKAQKVLDEKKTAIEALVKELLIKETIEKEEFEAIMNKTA